MKVGVFFLDTYRIILTYRIVSCVVCKTVLHLRCVNFF